MKCTCGAELDGGYDAGPCGKVDPSRNFPCMKCSKFVCKLGEAECELCKYGHKAKKCPKRIDTSTYAETSYIHGDCKKMQEESTFKFIVDDTEYTATGFVTQWERKSTSLPSRREITLKMVGELESRSVHSELHMTESISRHAHSARCMCKCAICFNPQTKKCICKECNCAN